MSPIRELILSIEQYGSYARGSALADYLEVAALKGEPTTISQLDSYIRKNDWFRVRRGMFTKNPDIDLSEVSTLENEDGTEDLDDPDWPEWTFSILRQRADVLGEQYPFDIDATTLSYDENNANGADYIRLLIVTVAHAYKANIDVNPRDVFERLVVAAVASMGFSSYGMGTASAPRRDFTTSLRDAALDLGMVAASTPYPALRYAKDSGVDALGVYNWRDKRPGQITLAVQATTAESKRWVHKIADPKPSHWAGYLNETMSPLVVLAVPHHVEDEHFRWLLSSASSTIMDRLRLVGRLGVVSDDERKLREWLNRCVMLY